MRIRLLALALLAAVVTAVPASAGWLDGGSAPSLRDAGQVQKDIEVLLKSVDAAALKPGDPDLAKLPAFSEQERQELASGIAQLIGMLDAKQTRIILENLSAEYYEAPGHRMVIEDLVGRLHGAIREELAKIEKRSPTYFALNFFISFCTTAYSVRSLSGTAVKYGPRVGSFLRDRMRAIFGGGGKREAEEFAQFAEKQLEKEPGRFAQAKEGAKQLLQKVGGKMPKTPLGQNALILGTGAGASAIATAAYLMYHQGEFLKSDPDAYLDEIQRDLFAKMREKIQAQLEELRSDAIALADTQFDEIRESVMTTMKEAKDIYSRDRNKHLAEEMRALVADVAQVEIEFDKRGIQFAQPSAR